MSFPLEEYIKQAKEENKSPAFIDATVSYAKNLDKNKDRQK